MFRVPFSTVAPQDARGPRAETSVTRVGLRRGVDGRRPGTQRDLLLPPGPYKYLVIDQDIEGVFVEFGRNVGLTVDVSDRVKGRLRGQISTATAREFLDGLCESYGLVWYFDGTTLHVNSKSEIRIELVGIGQLSPDEATKNQRPELPTTVSSATMKTQRLRFGYAVNRKQR